MPTSAPILHLTSAVLLLILLSSAAATDHIVGADKGWNPGNNYTLWANNQTFYVGDLISFRYQKTQYNVLEVNETGYDNCSTEGAIGKWSSGKDFIELNDTKRYYFICGTGGCFSGMKVSVTVISVHSLAPAGNPSPDAAAAAAEHSSPAGCGGGVLGVILGVVVSVWLGYGWF